MKQFGQYAQYYDDMYKNKSYEEETDLIESVFTKFSSIPVKKVLSLGCGTGTYEILMAKRGYEITGVDISAEMLKQAREKIEAAGFADKIKLVEGDIRSMSFLGSFDATIMMFNIAGYIHTPQDLTAVASSVSSQIPQGGVFLFDAWYGPAVVSDPPLDRTKVVEKDGAKITRVTRGVLDTRNKLVKITFDITVVKDGKTSNSVVEEHPMRYWDVEELEQALKAGGLSMVKATAFDNIDMPADQEHWNMQVVSTKI